MKFYRLVALAACQIIFFVGYAQDCSYTLSGRVVDEHNGEPLPYANIVVTGTAIGTQADAQGFYKIENLCAKSYTFSCSHIGCEPVEKVIQINQNTIVNFYPEHHTEDLERVEIIANNRLQDVDGQAIIDAEDVNTERGQSLGRAVANANGVRLLKTSNNIAKPIIHGMHSNRVLILNNGVRQEGQQWGSEHAPSIDPLSANEFTVLKKAAAVSVGSDAIGGVIFVEPAPLKTTGGLSGKANLAGYSNGQMGVASGVINYGFDSLPALQFRLQGSLKRGGNISSPDYFLDNSGVEERNFSFTTGYNVEKFGVELYYSQFNTTLAIFSGAHIGTLSDLQRAFDSDRPLVESDFSYEIGRPFQEVEHELTKGSAYWKISDNSKLSFIYGRQFNRRLEFDKDVPLNDSLAALNLPELQMELTTHTAQLNWDNKWHKRLEGAMGVDGFWQANTVGGLRHFIPNYEKTSYGVYVYQRYDMPINQLYISAGGRYAITNQQAYFIKNDEVQSPAFDYEGFSGNTELNYQGVKDMIFRVGGGLAWRPPAMNELFSKGLHHGAAAVENGNSELLKEESISIEAGASLNKKKLKLNLDIYQKQIDQFIYLVPTSQPTLTIRGAFPTFNFEQVPAIFRGADFNGKWIISRKFTLENSTSIVRAFHQTTKEGLVQIPADRMQNSLIYYLHTAKMKNAIRLKASFENVLEQTRVDPTIDFAPPPPGYNLVHLSARAKVRMGSQQITVDLGVNNLLNTSYRDYLNRFRYFTDEIGRQVSLAISIPINSKTKSQVSATNSPNEY